MARYGNSQKTVITYHGKNIIIDSKLEAKHMTSLIILEKAGRITDLILQPKFELVEGFMIHSTKVKSGKSKQSSISYTPDASYIDEFGRYVAFESKGYMTDSYKLRRRLFLSMLRKFKVDVFIEKFAKSEIEYKPY